MLLPHTRLRSAGRKRDGRDGARRTWGLAGTCRVGEERRWRTGRVGSMRIVLARWSLGNGLRRLAHSGFPLPRESLRFGDLSWGHPLGKRITSLSGSGFSLCGGEVVPHVGLDKVLEHAPALDIHQPQFGTSQSIFLLCRLTQPEQRHPVALRSPLSVEVHCAEVGLGSRVSLLRGLFKPLLRLPIVLGDPLAFVIQQAKFVLSGCITSFR